MSTTRKLVHLGSLPHFKMYFQFRIEVLRKAMIRIASAMQ